MRITWLGQGGLLLEHQGRTVMIDPYLSDSVEKSNPRMKRLVPADPRLSETIVDILICTHDHLDHTDPGTLNRLLDISREVTVLASGNAWNTVRELGFMQHNVIQFDTGTEVTVQDIHFYAIRAVHSDEAAIGVWISWDDLDIYVTGDTLYHPAIFSSLPGCPDMLFVCINGYGNNMNIVDAVQFANHVGAQCTIPVHWGMFAAADADPEQFKKQMKRSTWIPKIYQTVYWDKQEKRFTE